MNQMDSAFVFAVLLKLPRRPIRFHLVHLFYLVLRKYCATLMCQALQATLGSDGQGPDGLPWALMGHALSWTLMSWALMGPAGPSGLHGPALMDPHGPNLRVPRS